MAHHYEPGKMSGGGWEWLEETQLGKITGGKNERCRCYYAVLKKADRQGLISVHIFACCSECCL